MLQISEETIKEIAEIIDTGWECYFNPKTAEIIDIPADLDWDVDEEDDELWGDVKEKINDGKADLIKFERMNPPQSFRVMQEFAETVEDPKVQDRLYNALSSNKPFRRFKDEINYHDEYRKPWFDFKASKNIEYVRNLINLENIKSEEENEADE